MAGRQLDLPAKQFSLENVGEGWGACYVTYRQRSTEDIISLSELDTDSLNEASSTRYVLGIAKQHFVGGKVLIGGQLFDMEVDDLGSLPDGILVQLFQQINGRAYDPKDTSTMTDESSTKQLTTPPQQTSNS